MSGDSIVGYTGGASDSGRAAVALAEVREVEGRQVSFLKTAGTSFLVTTGVVVALVIVWIASL